MSGTRHPNHKLSLSHHTETIPWNAVGHTRSRSSSRASATQPRRLSADFKLPRNGAELASYLTVLASRDESCPPNAPFA